MAQFRMPSLGADMEAGTLVEWLVKPGDTVKRGDVVAVVETQKGAIEVEIFETGKIARLLVDVGKKVPVGTPLAEVITAAEEAAAAPARVEAVATAPPSAPRPAAAAAVAEPAAPSPALPVSPAPPPPAAGAAAAAEIRASPAARRLAEAHGIDLAKLAGSGPQGAIVLADVERAIGPEAPPTVPKRTAGIDLDAMRAAIAAAMSRSKREIPHYYLQHQTDLTAAEQWLLRHNADLPPERRLLMGALGLKAVALAARRFPAFNGFYTEGLYSPSAAVHVGMAIAIRGGGLAAPAIRDADALPLDVLMARMRDLVQRMRAGRIRSSEIADATITVSSLGERGVEALYGVIYPPQVAIVGIGRPVTRPWVIDGAIGPRLIVTLTLAADHRASDGHAGALFLAEIGKLLQEPDKL